MFGHVRCPVLVTPGRTIRWCRRPSARRSSPPCRPDARFEGFAESGQDLFGNKPERAFAVLREFIAAAWTGNNVRGVRLTHPEEGRADRRGCTRVAVGEQALNILWSARHASAG